MVGKWGALESVIAAAPPLFLRVHKSASVLQHCLSGPVCCAVRFEFDAIHNPSASQEEVFAAVRPLCEGALDGYNITVLAYGQVPFPYCVGALWWY